LGEVCEHVAKTGLRWDLAHGRLLVLARHDSSNSGLLDYWLVQLRAPATGRI
jgi:hypothetical protein